MISVAEFKTSEYFRSLKSYPSLSRLVELTSYAIRTCNTEAFKVKGYDKLSHLVNKQSFSLVKVSKKGKHTSIHKPDVNSDCCIYFCKKSSARKVSDFLKYLEPYGIRLLILIGNTNKDLDFEEGFLCRSSRKRNIKQAVEQLIKKYIVGFLTSGTKRLYEEEKSNLRRQKQTTGTIH